MRHARRDSMAGTNLAGTYQLGDCIGKGAFGSVYSGLNIETGEVVAIKQIRLANIPKSELGLIMSEIDLLKELNHPNIVKYTGFVKTKEHLNIVMEYCENGSLTSIYKKFGTFPEHLVAVYVGQVLDGLLYLHEQGVIHRDIKGANILTTKNGQVKLADFGIASKVDASNKAVVGSPYWMAPEVIELAGATTASDIWSVGCTTLELIEGRPPYHDLAPMSALFRIVQDDHPPIPEVTSKLLNDFLLECFQKDHNLRVSAKKLLKHPWIQNARKKVGAQASADVDREIERPRLKPAEDAWTKKHSPGFSGSTSSLASATSETVVNTISSLPPAPDAVRYRKAPVQSVVEIDLDDTNWEDDFEEGIAWPTVPKEPARPPSSTKSIPVPQSLPPSFTQPKATIIPVALPAPTPTAPSKPASEAAPLIQAQPTPRVDADEDTDIWDEDFEVPDTDVTIKLVKTASQPRLAVDSGHQQTLPQLANQAKTTNVLPTGKPVMINQYVEHPTTEEDDYSDLFGKEGGLPEPRRLSEVSSDLGIDSDEDDPFLSMIEDDSGEIGLKDKQAKLNGTVMELVRRLRPDQGAPVLIQTCDELVRVEQYGCVDLKTRIDHGDRFRYSKNTQKPEEI
ncbi:hypothetical protein HK097_008947 [Rhizophlyctis rosea]|uniref:non-specific serine/threonine protein kinase n=1 Tax=Rhizophlyctis rosea TaxID=64517 RepID=A0AAD5SBR7_9FUNG|nr:hypothetical protein HK097_008947 [Rhizophlyctis rosea]